MRYCYVLVNDPSAQSADLVSKGEGVDSFCIFKTRITHVSPLKGPI